MSNQSSPEKNYTNLDELVTPMDTALTQVSNETFPFHYTYYMQDYSGSTPTIPSIMLAVDGQNRNTLAVQDNSVNLLNSSLSEQIKPSSPQNGQTIHPCVEAQADLALDKTNDEFGLGHSIQHLSSPAATTSTSHQNIKEKKPYDRPKFEKEKKYKDYFCYLCTVAKRSKELLAEHIYTMHDGMEMDESKVVCVIPKVKIDPQKLPAHMCIACQQVCSRSSSFKSHLKSLKHISVLVDLKKISGETRELLSKHQHLLKKIDTSNEEMALKSLRDIVQNFCQEETTSNQNVSNSSHTCSDCKRTFNMHSNLAIHLRSLKHVKKLVELGRIPGDSLDVISTNLECLQAINVTNSETMLNELLVALDRMGCDVSTVDQVSIDEVSDDRNEKDDQSAKKPGEVEEEEDLANFLEDFANDHHGILQDIWGDGSFFKDLDF